MKLTRNQLLSENESLRSQLNIALQRITSLVEINNRQNDELTILRNSNAMRWQRINARREASKRYFEQNPGATSVTDAQLDAFMKGN